MSSVSLSFCIPTYNRCARVVELVQSILSCDVREIEVVVLDNASTDDTAAHLHAIADERLTVRRNESNMGALYNGLHALSMGHGDYVVCSLDKDSFDPEYIVEFQNILSENQSIACGYVEFNSLEVRRVDLLKKGFSAVQRVAYRGAHPTGCFFRREYLQEIDFLRRFSDPGLVGFFPLDLMLAELCMKGDAVVFHGPMFKPETQAMAARQKSFHVGGESKDAFYSPQCRLKTALNFVRHVQEMDLTVAQKSQLISDIFIRGISMATAGYRALLANPDLCAHYRLQVRIVGPIEFTKIGVWYYAAFHRAIWTALRWGFVNKMKLHAMIAIKVVLKGLQKIIKRLPGSA